MLFRRNKDQNPAATPDNRPESTFRAPRRVGVLLRALCFLAGVDAERLSTCPADDRQATVRIGLAMLVSFCFVTAALTAGMSIAFSMEGSAAVQLLPIGLLMAAAYIYLDHAIIHADWYDSGLRTARERGFDIEGPKPVGVAWRVVRTLLRLILSGVLALCLASFLDLVIYGKDIERQRQADHRAVNAEAFALAARQVNAEVTRRDNELPLLERAEAAALARHEEASRALHAMLREQSAARDTRLAQLQVTRDALLAEATRRRNDAIAEEHGRREAPHHTGVAGRRGQYQAAIAFAEQAEARAAEVQAEIDRLRSPQAGPERELQAAVASARADLDRLAERRRTVLAERDRLVAGRETAIRATAEADPRFVPLEGGLIERQAVFLRLVRDREVAATVLILSAFFMVVEMAGLLAKLLNRRVSVYAVRTAVETEAMIAAELARAEAEISAHAQAIAQAQEARAEQAMDRERRARQRRATSFALDRVEDELV